MKTNLYQPIISAVLQRLPRALFPVPLRNYSSRALISLGALFPWCSCETLITLRSYRAGRSLFTRCSLWSSSTVSSVMPRHAREPWCTTSCMHWATGGWLRLTIYLIVTSRKKSMVTDKFKLKMSGYPVVFLGINCLKNWDEQFWDVVLQGSYEAWFIIITWSSLRNNIQRWKLSIDWKTVALDVCRVGFGFCTTGASRYVRIGLLLRKPKQISTRDLSIAFDVLELLQEPRKKITYRLVRRERQV